MRLACRYALPLAFVTVGSLVAQAHPGHAQELVSAESPWHYWLQPEHAMFSGVVLAMLGGFILAIYPRWVAARRAQRMTPLPVVRRRAGSDR